MRFLAGVVGLWLVIAAAAPRLVQHEGIPNRIVSVIPAITEMLFAIGAGQQIVGVSSFARFPDEIKGLTRVGALLDPDMERIFSLRPDLVALYSSQVDLRIQLDRARIPVFSYEHGELSDVTATMRELGRRTGHEAKAEQAAQGIERELAAIRARVAGRARPTTLLVIGREPDMVRNVYASGGIGFLQDMIETAGGRNTFAHVEREAVQPTSEAILAAAPDVIVEVRADDILTPEAIERERAVWQRLSTIPAVRTGRVHFLIGSELVVPGPRVARGTERLARVLHPDAF